MSNTEERNKLYAALNLDVQIADLLLGVTHRNPEGLPDMSDFQNELVSDFGSKSNSLLQSRERLKIAAASVIVGFLHCAEISKRYEIDRARVAEFAQKYWSAFENNELTLTLQGYGRRRDCSLDGFKGVYADELYANRVAQYRRMRAATHILQGAEFPDPFNQQVVFFALGDTKTYSLIEGHIRDGVIMGVERSGFLPVQGPWHLPRRETQLLRAYASQKNLKFSPEVSSHLCSRFRYLGQLGSAALNRSLKWGVNVLFGAKKRAFGPFI